MKRILIIEDSKLAQFYLTDILNDHYELRFCNNGPDGLTAAFEAPPDIILLDIHLPKMDGYEVCRGLKTDSRTSNIPVIFVSSLDSDRQKLKGLEAGAEDYIVKPFYPGELLDRIKIHLSLHAGSGRKETDDGHAPHDVATEHLGRELDIPLHSAAACLSLLESELAGPSDKIQLYLSTLRRELENARLIAGRLRGTPHPVRLG